MMRDLLESGDLEGERTSKRTSRTSLVEDTLAAYGMGEFILGARTTFMGASV